jgi:hypothetical protein
MNYFYVLMNSAPTPEIIAGKFLLGLYYGIADRLWPGIQNARLEFLRNADDVAGEEFKSRYCGKSVFLGTANSCRSTLLDSGVKETDIIDARGANAKGLITRSSLLSLIEKMDLKDEHLLRLAKTLSDGRENPPPFHVANILKAIYDAQENNTMAGVEWWMEVLDAIYTDKRFFQRDDLVPRAGIFFEKIACMWALYRNRPSKEMQTRLIQRYFPENSNGEAPDFNAVLKSIGKEKDPKLTKIRTFVSDHCSKMRDLLSLPRLMHCLANEKGLECAIIRSFEALDAKRDEQAQFLEAVAILQSENVGVRDVVVKGKPAVALHVISNNTKINAAADWLADRNRKNLAVVLQERTDGNPMIFAGSGSEVRLIGVARRIRKSILKKYDMENDFPGELLEAPGVTCGLNEVTVILKNESGSGSDMVLGATRSYPEATEWPTSIAEVGRIIVEEIDESRPVQQKPAVQKNRITIRRQQPAAIAA